MKNRLLYIFMISALFLTSCKTYEDVQVLYNEVMDTNRPNNVYLSQTFGISTLKSFPDWAENLKSAKYENPYAINVYTDYDLFDSFAKNTLKYNENIFYPYTNKEIFDTSNVLAIARRIDNSSYAYYCSYSNYKYENKTHYIDANYIYKSEYELNRINYIIDLVLVDKNILNDVSSNKCILTQNYYSQIQSDVNTKKLNGYNYLTFTNISNGVEEQGKFFKKYDEFCNYVNDYINVDIKEFIDKSWFKDNYVFVSSRVEGGNFSYEYYKLWISGNTVNATYYTLGAALTAVTGYLDIVFIPKTKLMFINFDKTYKINYKPIYKKQKLNL